MTLREVMEPRGLLPAKDATKQELQQLIGKGCFRPFEQSEINLLHKLKQRILPSKLFLKISTSCMEPLTGKVDAE